jgi:hypothetical protein
MFAYSFDQLNAVAYPLYLCVQPLANRFPALLELLELFWFWLVGWWVGVWISDKFYLLTSVFVEYDKSVEVGGKAS